MRLHYNVNRIASCRLGSKVYFGCKVRFIAYNCCKLGSNGLVINYGEGGGGLQNGKIAGLKLFAPPPQDRVKLFTPPLLGVETFSDPPAIWLKLQATT